MESTLYLSCCSFLNFVKIWTKLVGFLHYFQVFMRYLPFHNFESISFNLMGSRLYLIFVGNGCRWRNQLIAGVGLGTKKKVGDPRWVQIKSWGTPLTFKPQLFHSCPMDWDFLFFSLKKQKNTTILNKAGDLIRRIQINRRVGPSSYRGPYIMPRAKDTLHIYCIIARVLITNQPCSWKSSLIFFYKYIYHKFNHISYFQLITEPNRHHYLQTQKKKKR